MRKQRIKGDKAYPKFNRRENRACKLTEEQIIEIQNCFRKLRPLRNSNLEIFHELAVIYKVHYQTIHYWCIKQYRETVLKQSIEKTKREWREHPERVKERMKISKKDWKQRKGNRLKIYNNEQVKTWYRLQRKFIALHQKEFDNFLEKNAYNYPSN